MIWAGIELVFGIFIGYILLMMVLGLIFTFFSAVGSLFSAPKQPVLRFTGKPYGHPDHEGLDEELMDEDEIISFSQERSRA